MEREFIGGAKAEKEAEDHGLRKLLEGRVGARGKGRGNEMCLKETMAEVIPLPSSPFLFYFKFYHVAKFVKRRRWDVECPLLASLFFFFYFSSLISRGGDGRGYSFVPLPFSILMFTMLQSL